MLTLDILLDVMLLRGRVYAQAVALLLGGHSGHDVVNAIDAIEVRIISCWLGQTM